MVQILPFIAFALGVAWTTLAHPGHSVAEEAAERVEFFKRNPKTLRSCAEKLRARGFDSTNVARRRDLADHLRKKRGITMRRRDFSTYNVSHHVTDASISLGADEMTLFADNSSCALQTEVTQGPYYVNGELIRQNLVDGQEGVPLTLDIQIIDTSTCEPVPALFIDFWHCNATGVYSGVVANGNGNSNDTTNLDKTFARGIQQTDSNGVAQFETIFPGHYTGRATHIHVLTHSPNETTIRLNDTLLGTNSSAGVHASHVGQIFFDQSLISQVEAVSPYSSNTQDVTLNSADDILGSEADGGTDPFANYVLLGDTVEDGILAWISIGIDPTQDQEVSNAATYYESGGVANANSDMGGGGGSPPNGTDGGAGAPTGSMPPLDSSTSTSTA